MIDQKMTVVSLGTVKASASSWEIELKPEYKDALIGLEGFSHVQVLF
jgi:tRNA (Thr-GGU) A37 N-methylase